MPRKVKVLLAALLNLMITLPCIAAVVSSVSVPTTRASGTTITSTIWNNDVIGIYTYINNNIVPALNVLTNKGDLYVYNGSNLARLPVGTDGQILTSNSGTTLGLAWASFANAAALTTKGDLLAFGSVAARLPVGSDGQVLVSDSTQTLGVKWGTPTTTTPKGAVLAWSPTFAGSSAVPSGWLLCDGTGGTPNLIGKFIVGTKPTGSAATAASGGYGAQTPDAAGSGIASHTHTITASGTTGPPSTTLGIDRTSPTTLEVSGYGHLHTVSYSGTSGSTSTEPSDYSLVYIIKQ